MSNSKKRIISQILFIGLFFFLLFRGNLQIWVAFWALGIVISLIFDRVYCGWACPMGILLRFQSWIFDKLNLSRKGISSRLILNSFRVILILGFLAGMIAVRGFDQQLNIILILVGSSLVISFFFGESFWHRICPHGTVLVLAINFLNTEWRSQKMTVLAVASVSRPVLMIQFIRLKIVRLEI